MLPFTLNHLGMLVPIANEFLLGTKKSIFQSSPNEYNKRTTTNKTGRLVELAMHKKRHVNILTTQQTPYGKQLTYAGDSCQRNTRCWVCWCWGGVVVDVNQIVS